MHDQNNGVSHLADGLLTFLIRVEVGPGVCQGVVKYKLGGFEAQAVLALVGPVLLLISCPTHGFVLHICPT